MRIIAAFGFAAVCFAAMGLTFIAKREVVADDHTQQSPLRLAFSQKAA